MTVADYHTYYVTQRNVLVHNDNIKCVDANGDSNEIKLKGLSQNRNLNELTHQDLINVFENTGYELSNHAIKRLKDARTQKLGFKTPNDIAKVFNKGNRFDAGRGEVGNSYKGLEAIIDPKTQRIVTFRPAKNRGN